MITAIVLKPTRIEWISFWILMPVIAVATSYLLYGNRIFADVLLLIGAFTAVYLIGFFSWYLHIVSMHILAELMPQLSQTLIRLVLLALVHIMLISLTMFVYFYGFNAIHYLGYTLNPENFRTGIYVGLFLTMIATSLWQVEFIFNKWKASLSEKELVEQQRLVHEFENLKKQINPHFLFNNLNILSSLISEEKEKAEYFLDELSTVYRYLLKNTDEDLTTLHSELHFIKSYYNLLKIRYNDSVIIKMDVDDKYVGYTLPSFALQLLVENAVKHNIASKAKPLTITINTNTEDGLVVSNNLQKKSSTILSNQVGLANIADNYRLLFNRQLQVDKSETSFSVTLPLIKP